MSDPFFEAHEVVPGFFILSVYLSPVSIRDQMIRGQWLAERLLQHKRFTPVPVTPKLSAYPELPVVIVGAGVAGITAAITLALGNVPVLVIDSAPTAFSRQGASTTRWLDPMQYDWPASSWTKVAFNPGKSLLPYPAARSNHLARDWRIVWGVHRTLRPYLLRVKYRCSINTIVPSGTLFNLALSDNSPSFQAQAVIWAAGFGDEKCEVSDQRAILPPPTVPRPTFRGTPFWGFDSLEKPGCGVGVPNPKVAILGSGDGAIQDALRALTKMKSAREIYSALKLPPEFGLEIMEAEDQMHRHWIWTGKAGNGDHPTQAKLDDVHAKMVDKVWRDQNFRQAALSLIPYPDEEIKVFHRCAHLTCYYPLNRFLAHLFAKVLDSLGRPFLMGGRSVVRVHGSGTNWILDTVVDPKCTGKAAVAGALSSEHVNLIVVRYGIESKAAVPPWPINFNLLRRRHSLPNNPSPA